MNLSELTSFLLRSSENLRFNDDIGGNLNKSVRLTLSWRRPLSYRNQSIDLLANQWTCFYDNGLRLERVKFG